MGRHWWTYFRRLDELFLFDACAHFGIQHDPQQHPDEADGAEQVEHPRPMQVGTYLSQDTHALSK